MSAPPIGSSSPHKRYVGDVTLSSSDGGSSVSSLKPRIVIILGVASISLRRVSVSRSSDRNHAISTGPNVPDSTARRRPICLSIDRAIRSDTGIRVARRRRAGCMAMRMTSGVETTGAPKLQLSVTTRSMRAGCAAAARNAKYPPKEVPITCATSTSSASSTSTTRPSANAPSAAMSASGRSRRGLRPHPGRSTRTQPKVSRRDANDAQLVPPFDAPCTNTTGSPSPTSWMRTRAPVRSR